MDSSSEQFNVLAVNMNNKQNDDRPITAQYSMPGILHFLQTEWARFETDRAQWEIDRAELQAKVAFLQGERRGQENLKVDLVRRIKMLEYALKQERSKYHKLKYGTELDQGDMIPPNFEKDSKDDRMAVESNNIYNNNNGTWKHGRQLLRQYLQEIGYTDTIIDVRSARIRQMLGLPSRDTTTSETKALVAGIEAPSGKRPIETQGNGTNIKKMPASVTGPASAVNNAQDAIMASFDFLGNENMDDDEDEDVDVVPADIDNGNDLMNIGRQQQQQMVAAKNKDIRAQVTIKSAVTGDEMEADTEDALAEFDFLGSAGGEDGNKAPGQSNSSDWVNHDLSPNEEWNVDEQMLTDMKERYKQERRNKDRKTLTGLNTDRPSRSALKAMLENLDAEASRSPVNINTGSDVTDGSSPTHNGKVGFLDNDDVGNEPTLGLGELADLSVNNDADIAPYDNTGPCDMQRKVWTAKYTLRSHFDGVRAVVFHPVEEVVITAGEDHVLKLWNLQKTAAAKKTALLDVEATYTLRGHSGPVLSLAMSITGEFCYSGGIDGCICCWNIPNVGVDPYDAYDPSVLHSRLLAHTDAVWGLSMHGTKEHLLSCSSDGTVRLWNPASQMPLLNTYRIDTEKGVPTSVDFVSEEPNHMVVSYSANGAYIFDMEKSVPFVTFDYAPSTDYTGPDRINRVLSHPTLPVTITAHEDRNLRFFDNNSGKLIHSMVAHLDAINSIAVDSSGLYILTGSHDCSVRLWNLETKTCVQEVTAHRKKFDESINDVAFHPTKPFFASAGADALVKVYV